MHFLLFYIVPNQAIDDVPCKLTHSNLLLRAKHGLAVILFAHILLGRFSKFHLLTRVHHDLQFDQLIIIIEHASPANHFCLRHELPHLFDVNLLISRLFFRYCNLLLLCEMTVDKSFHQLTFVVAGVGAKFLTLFKLDEFFVGHVVCQHLVVLFVIFHVKVVLIFTF